MWLVAESAGRDLYCLVRHDWQPSTEAEHKTAWQAADELLENLTNSKTDKGPKGYRSGRFIAHDPHVYVRPEEDVVPIPRPQQALMPKIDTDDVSTALTQPPNQNRNGTGTYEPLTREEIALMLDPRILGRLPRPQQC